MTKSEMLSMSEWDVLALAQKEANRNGYEIMSMKKLPHELDSHLRKIIARNEKKEEYVVWLFNVQYSGMSNGKYFSYAFNKDKQQACDFAILEYLK
jgi:hypothetical protein